MCVGRCAPHSAPHGGVDTAKTYADGSCIAYDYTADGKRTRTTWARGAWRQNAYNERNLVSGTTYSDAATPSVAYTYADSGAVAAATLSDGTSYGYSYDARLLCTNESVAVGGEAFAVNRTHDGFRRASETAVVVADVRHAAKVRLYDSEDRVCGYALTNAAGRGVSVTLAYDGSHVTNVAYTLPNGGVLAVNLTRERARKEFVTRRDCFFGGQPVYWYETGYDLLGRPTNATDSASLTREWLYNHRSELAAAAVGTNRYGYAYDAIGNRLWSAANAVTNSYAVNCLNQYASILRASAPPREIVPQYDADGNMTRDGRFAYAYDAENRLVAVTSAAETNGAICVLNFYDHRSRRIRKVVQRLSVGVAPPPSPPAETRKWETTETHTFVWDGMNVVLERVAFADGTTRMVEYFWGLDKSGSEQGAGGVGGLLAASLDGVFHVPCYDHNGNIVRYVSETGAIVAQYVYAPYGNVVESSGPLADVFAFGFSTKCRDRETGLVAYQRRFYSPGLGRWLSRDPIGEEGGENLYAFGRNSPSWLLDALGLELLIIKHWKGIDPPGGWGDRGRNRGQTHYREPSISYRRISKGNGKIGFEVCITPPVSRVDVYFHEDSDLQVTAFDENEHIQWIIKYDKAIETFKRDVEAIVDCPERAYLKLAAAIDRLNVRKRWIVSENNKLDAPGGPHGHTSD